MEVGRSISPVQHLTSDELEFRTFFYVSKNITTKRNAKTADVLPLKPWKPVSKGKKSRKKETKSSR